ncbi:RhoGAP domain containing protein [Trichomonas vaginalis G3]|uniref:RhoGAP domain containing protein n=1 Tax=Trichomonas vaginalis (strain ATCC PRA-98 / G3) TaxID=412133 RepID=A2DD87_TRIV3|nr:GTPase activator protein [Trichomonas vaginalis G3]EAY21566.1 RhoGAP domain containing protein [Trichomonas vaginalis G3]KAI5489759.1 GTPase activator protein [Trichomonas vaginalis G3]|eukprot:XP_001582552.1 RhoGAP domain containing protein [Trichomonas vaginalis G3]
MQSDFDPSKITYKGTMEKCGGNVKNWKKRTFVISEVTLYYFKDATMTEELGKIPLIDTTLTLEPETEGPGFYFKLHLAPNASAARTDYLFRSPTEAERTEWINEITKASKTTIFNKPLLNALKINPDDRETPLPIPYFIKTGVDYLNANGLKVEGIYRLNGSSANIETLQKQINMNEKVSYSDVHTATGLIKLYLRTTPDSILLKKNYDALQTIANLPEDKQGEPVSQIVRTIPLPNYVLLHYMYSHLRKILEFADQNKMSERALGVCIGPSIVTCNEESANAAYNESAVQQSISTAIFQNFDLIFGQNPLMRFRSTSNTDLYRVKKNQIDYPYILKAPANAVVQSVCEDATGWYICVYNDQWGLIHNSMLEKVNSPFGVISGLASQDKKWTIPEEILERFAAECPEASQLYEILFNKLKDLRAKAKKMSN